MKTYTNILTKETYKTLRAETRNVELDGQLEKLSGILFEVLETGKEKFLTDWQIHKLVVSA